MGTTLRFIRLRRPRWLRNRLAVAGTAIVVLLVLSAIFAPYLTPYDPYAVNLREELLPPGTRHLLGTDQDGADIFSRILYGARISLLVGSSTVAFNLVVGATLGSISGWFGRGIDRLIMFVTDVFLGFPGILLPIAITAVFRERSVLMVITALCVSGWVGYCRVARGQVLALKQADFIVAAVACGVPSRRILSRYLLPNILSPLVVQATFGMAGAILAEAALSFLGLGVAPGTPSWGAMLNQGRHYLLVAPHLSIYPGLAIMLVVLGFNFLGDGLRDALDPRRAGG